MTDARATVRELRRTRTRHRLGSTDWYDVAYRVYLFAFGGLVAVVLISDAIDGLVDDEVTTTDLLDKGPSILGIAAAVALAIGLRSGADGGPVAIETADTRHLLLAPISRRMVMFTPIWQRFRSLMFGLALACAVVGQLVATELEGSRAAWAAAAGAYGALVGALFVGSAVVSHALRCPRWLATLIGVLVVGWQCAAAWNIWNDSTVEPSRFAPASSIGGIALWGIEQRPTDLVAVLVVVSLVVGALMAGDRLRLEPLARRGDLVSQLRFAATSQDLRTVVLLRRQLRNETLRNRPWLRGGSESKPAPTAAARATLALTRPATGRRFDRPNAVWRRGIVSLRRLPASRLARIGLVAVAAGAFGSLTVTSSIFFALGLLASIFVLGLESIEALSQEVDRADRTESLPVQRGWLFANHLVAPAALLVIAALVAATTSALLEPANAAAAFAVAVPVMWGGALGPVVATVNDAPPTRAAADMTLTGAKRDEMSFVPPEFAGFSTVASTLLPVLLSVVGVVPVVVLRFDPTVATLVRAVIGVVLAIVVTVRWVVRRDLWGLRIRNFFAEGRAAR